MHIHVSPTGRKPYLYIRTRHRASRGACGEGGKQKADAAPGRGRSAAVVGYYIIIILYHTILYYIILYYTILYYTILYYTILYYSILYYTYHVILYYIILYYIILYYTIPYYIILYYTIYSLAEVDPLLEEAQEEVSKLQAGAIIIDQMHKENNIMMIINMIMITMDATLCESINTFNMIHI